MEILTILNPGSIDLEPTSRRTDKDGLSAALVSAAMAGADEIGVMVLMRRVGGDTSAYKEAYIRLTKGVIRVAKQNKWKLTNCDKVKDLLNLCLYEYIHPIKCPTCRGTGFYRYKECPTCLGTTNYTLNDTQRAQAIGVHRSNWRRTWAIRHKQVTDYLTIALPDHESRALSRIYKLMKSRP